MKHRLWIGLLFVVVLSLGVSGCVAPVPAEPQMIVVTATPEPTTEPRPTIKVASNVQIPLRIYRDGDKITGYEYEVYAEALNRAGYDVEVVEAHHRFKRDAPSGTALELSRHIAGARNQPWPECLEHGREGKDALRREKSIGMHAVRGGDIVGQHSVIFSALGETVTLQHQAHSRDTFVRGALLAAKWLASRQKGMYNMFDVLGL